MRLGLRIHLGFPDIGFFDDDHLCASSVYYEIGKLSKVVDRQIRSTRGPSSCETGGNLLPLDVDDG